MEDSMYPAQPFYRILSLSLLALIACGEGTPTQLDLPDDLGPPALSLAAASNTWTPKAAPPFDQYIYGYALAMASNSAGHSIVYAFGGTSADDGGIWDAPRAYDVVTNTWTSRRISHTGIYYSNGVGKIGSKLYFSGGYVTAGSLPDATNALWAYDYSNDRMIKKADLPIFSAEGVTGVIDGKLYVLPGACDGNRYPQRGSCAEEQTRRFYRYDPSTNTWVARRQAPHFHRGGAATVIDGKLYVAGGLSGEGFTPVADLDMYDPATNTWRTLPPIPTGGAASGASLHGQFFVIVSSSPNHAYAYNRITNQWKTKAVPPAWGAVTQVALNGNTYLFTATGDKSFLYTP